MMDSRSQETLRRVQENDDTLTELRIGRHRGYRRFNSSDGDDYSTLGTCIGENTRLTKLAVVLVDVGALDVTNNEFYDGIKQNSSIHCLTLYCGGHNIVGGVGQKILEAYQENNNLTELRIHDAALRNGGENVIATTLRNSTNLKHIDLYSCNITIGQLLPIVDAIRGHRSLEKLFLRDNRIGNAGCETIATLLENTGCNLQIIDLGSNDIRGEGASILANGLANNTKLRGLYLYGNLMDNQSSADIFSEVLCNTSSINNTYLSNHTIEKLELPQLRGEHLDSLLYLNEGTNKNHVAIKKILKYHPNVDTKPLFEWNMEGEGERDLKALPYVIAWFERAGEAVSGDEGGEESYNIDERKLTVMYQFAKDMPLLFVPVLHDKKGENK